MNKLIKTIALISLLAMPLQSSAEEASAKSKQLAKQLIDIMDINKFSENFSTGITQAMFANFQQKECINMEYFSKQMDGLISKYIKEVFTQKEADFIQVYTDSFTEAELQDIINFYSSPTGKKTLSQMGVAMQKSNKIAQDYLTGKQAEFSKEIETIVKASIKEECKNTDEGAARQ